MSAASSVPSAGRSRSFILFQIAFYLALAIFPVLTGSVWIWQLSFGIFFLAVFGVYYWLFVIRKDLERLRSTPLDGPIAVYVGILLLSAVFSKIPMLSVIEIYKTLCALAVFWAAVYAAKDRTRIMWTGQFFLFLGAALSIVGLLQFLGGLPKDWWHRPYFMSSTYVNHNHFAGLLVLCLPVSLGFSFAERDSSKKILYFFLCGIMGTAFVFTLSRGGLLALTASVIFLVVLLTRSGLIRSSAVPFVLFVTLVVGSVMILGVGPIEQRIENIRNMTLEEELSLTYRMLTWQGALRMIPVFPLLGSGPGTFGSVFLRFRPEGFSQRPVHAHNDLLELAADGGILLLAAAIWLFWRLFSSGVGVLTRDDSRLRAGLGSGILAAIFGLLVHGLIDFNFHIPANWMYVSALAGLLFAIDRPSAPDTLRARAETLWVQSMVFITVAVGALWLGIADYHFWEAREMIKLRSYPAALASLQKSLQRVPWNAEAYYLKGFSRNAMDRLRSSSVGVESMRQSVDDIDRAIRLDPFEPYYDFHKARIQAPVLAEAAPQDLLRLYHLALQKDPNNPQLAYFCAKDLLHYDKAHKPILRAGAETILRHVIELNPDYAEGVYALLWEHEPNASKVLAFHETVPAGLSGFVAFLEKEDLWRYHRKYYVKLLGIPLEKNARMLKETRWNETDVQTWDLNDFSSTMQDPVHFDEFFHTRGELTKKVNFRNSLNRIVIHARSSPMKGTYPMLAVKVDGRVFDVHYMDSKVFKNYYSLLEVPPGDHLLTLAYLNDQKDLSGSGEDRNLWIDRVQMQEPLAA